MMVGYLFTGTHAIKHVSSDRVNFVVPFSFVQRHLINAKDVIWKNDSVDIMSLEALLNEKLVIAV